MGPLNCFPLEFLLNVPASRDHVHRVEKLDVPIGIEGYF
jgi:hypothetical protein